jgi:isopentenyl-diphosphate Delta-isomerase
MDREENVDVLNSSGKKTGRVVTKSQVHKLGLWHSAAHIWIYNSKGELLLQKRSMQKENYPGLWDISVAGHVSAGEKPKEAAIRELSEELGIKVDPKKLKKIFVTKASIDHKDTYHDREFDYVYILKSEIPPNKLKLQKEEVSAIELISLQKFEKELKNKKMTKRYVLHTDLFKVIAAVRKELK